MLDSDQIRIEIRGFFPGSVVVNFTIIYVPSQIQDVNNVSTAVFHSLMNSTKYTMDQNNTHINGICPSNLQYVLCSGSRYKTRKNCSLPYVLLCVALNGWTQSESGT